MGITRSKVCFSFFLSLHHLNNRLENSSLLFKSVAKIKLFLGRKNIGGAFAHSLAPPSYAYNHTLIYTLVAMVITTL
jgi:hypothetical protein